MANQVYDIVNERILAALEAGVIPWKKTWTGGLEPMNLVSGKAYRGINRMLLGLTPYASPYWVTFKQAQALKGTVRKGEKSSLVTFWKFPDKDDGQTEIDGTGKPSRGPILRYYRVFNVEQCDGLDSRLPVLESPESREFSPIEGCERLLASMAQRPAIEHGPQRAFYSPSRDIINMPKPETFDSGEAYYSTLWHETIHWTGHTSRLARFTGEAANAAFGSQTYGKEELIAEMGAAYLCNVTGIDNADVTENTVAYLQGWMRQIRGNKSLIVTAASAAQKATDYILGKE